MIGSAAMRHGRLLTFILAAGFALAAGCTSPDSAVMASPPGGALDTKATPAPEPPTAASDWSYAGTFRADLSVGACVDPTLLCPRYASGRESQRIVINHTHVSVAREAGWAFSANWTPTGSQAPTLMLRILQIPSGQVVAHSESASPMDLRLPGDALVGGSEYAVEFLPSLGHVFVNQEVDWVLRLDS